MTGSQRRIVILMILTTVTLIFHFYSDIWIIAPGQSNFMHHVLADLCYIPIILSGIWFGLRGAVVTSTVISIFSFSFTLMVPPQYAAELLSDYVEIIFFYLVGAVSGIVLDRDRRLRQRLNETQDKLHQAERLSIIGQMVASIVHEIKSPLVSIMGASRILRDNSISDKQRNEYAGVIENEARRLDDVVHLLLTYPRPNSTVLTEIDVREPLMALRKQLAFQSNMQGVQISFKTAEVPPIKGDLEKLYQVFSNIIINAMQAMPGGGKVDVNCFYAPDNSKGTVKVEISDNGPGITKEAMPHIFMPFYTTKSGGTGLGLAICKTIIKEHGGCIEVESVVGQGTKFSIAIPAANKI